MRLLIETSTVQFRVAGLPKRKIVKGQEAITRGRAPGLDRAAGRG